MSGYHTGKFCQESLLYDFFTGEPVPVLDLANDVLVEANRASSTAQEATHDAKFAYMDAVVGNVAQSIIKKTFTGSGRLAPLCEFNDGLNHGYRDTWFGFLEDTIEEALCQCVPGQRVTVVMLTPDRFARPPYFHPHHPNTWGLTGDHFKHLDDWLIARFGNRRSRFRFLTFFAGTPGRCRGFQTSVGMRYTGKHNGRPAGSRDKKPRVRMRVHFAFSCEVREPPSN